MPVDIGGFQITAGMESHVLYSAPPMGNLVVHLDASRTASYPGTGTSWYDIMGTDNNATLTNGPTFNSSNGGSIVFDGTDDYALLNYSPGVTSNISVVSWNHISGTSLRGPFVKVGGTTGYAIGVGGSTFDNSGNRFLGLYAGRVWINTGDNLGTGWVMTSIVLNSSSHATFYLNKLNALTYTSNVPIAPTPNSYIGRNVGDEPSGARAFAGRIAVVLIYNKALSSTEISTIYDNYKSRFGL